MRFQGPAKRTSGRPFRSQGRLVETTQGQKVQLDHAFQNVRSKNARFQYVRKLRQNVRADATKLTSASQS